MTKKLLLTICVLIIAATAHAAISVIGTPQTGNANNGGAVTLTWSTQPSTNDYTIVVTGCPADNTTDAAMTTTGYSIHTYYEGVGATKPKFWIFYKKQGASPDTTAVVTATCGTATDTSAIGIVLRGVDGTTFSDQTPTTAGETTSTNPDANQIVTQTNGAYVIVAALMISVKDTAITAPSGYTGYSQVGDDTNDHTLAAAYKEVATAGTENPASWTVWDSGLWYAITIAVKPYVPTCNDSCALCSTSEDCAGSAQTCYWWGDPASCQDTDDPCNLDCTDCSDEPSCGASSLTCYWWGSPASCQATDDPCNSDCTQCADESACDASPLTCYWYNSTCNTNPPPVGRKQKSNGMSISGVVIR